MRKKDKKFDPRQFERKDAYKFFSHFDKPNILVSTDAPPPFNQFTGIGIEDLQFFKVS
jgi:hypothetical protein